jgi:acetyltransferase-like isoleucine patch superfamily enzyme
MIDTINSVMPPSRRRRLFPRQNYRPSFQSAPVIIENDVWIGTGAVVLKGTRIGHGSIIGAGSVVSGNIPPRSLVVGNPARVVHNLDTP